MRTARQARGSLSLQRAEIVGDALGQHRHDAVREIDRVAALPRFLVERAAGPHIGGDVGDGDDHHPAAAIGGVGIGFGPDRIVMVARVGGIDGDERQVPQILAALELGLLGRLGLGKHGFGKAVGDAVGMDGDQARHLLRLRIAEPLGDAGGLHAEARGARKLEAHQLAVLGVARGAARHRPFLQLLAVDRIDHAGAARKRAKDAEQAPCGACQALDGARLIGIVGIGAERGDARQHAVADAGDGAGVALALDHEDAGRRRRAPRPRWRAGR